MKIQPFNNFIIIKLDEGAESIKHGTLTLETHHGYRLPKKTGTVKAVGRGIVTAAGEIVPTQAKPGDRVFVFETKGDIEIEYDGEKCILLKDESAIVGLITEETAVTEGR